ncbi:argininosuccinate lyase [Candidatus Poriferisodalis sp.]|uniref:argininosuccinate lyase n=1 Tax=Candidatus Poriferisodalis sp. TaxID=3101277 RepID=UPI003B027B25
MFADDTSADGTPPAGTASGDTPSQSIGPSGAGPTTLWHGRFAGAPADALAALNDSLPFDQRMFVEDIAASRAHVSMLAAVGLLTDGERDDIVAALDEVESEIAEGRMVWAPTDEDIHTAVERRASELCAAAAKMHTGRSRNDQVATDLRLWTRGAIDELTGLLLGLARTLAARAREAHAGGLRLPGYTHLQQAQPVGLAHHLAAHAWALLRDVERLGEARQRTDVSPLGAGALAGSTLPLDPAATAADLGFAAVFENSLDAVSDRDFVADTLFALAMSGIHLSRLGEELVLWSSAEFGFVVLDDAFATGSSMMPQKKNPDVAELARGKAGRLIGHLTGLLATLKGLPLAYNKDLQEDKEPLFDAVDTVRLVVLALDGLMQTVEFNAAAMAAAADDPFTAATDLAEWLVARGMPFRDAHGVIAGLVRQALDDAAVSMRARRLTELVSAHPDLGQEAARLLAPGAAYHSRSTPGAGGPDAVEAQLERLDAALAADSNGH